MILKQKQFCKDYDLNFMIELSISTSLLTHCFNSFTFISMEWKGILKKASEITRVLLRDFLDQVNKAEWRIYASVI